MNYGSVSGIGGNIASAAFQGAAFYTAKALNLGESVLHEIAAQHRELTSPFPLVRDAVSNAIGVSSSQGAAATMSIPSAGRNSGWER